MSGLLEVEGLTIRFPALEAVSGLSFTVSEGETVALVGESGSGKSLTALALMGLLPAQGRIAAGSIRLDGRELKNLPEREFRRLRGRDIAMIFQEPMTSLNPVLSIGQQIIETLRAHEGLSRRLARRRAIELLDLVKIPDPAHRLDDAPHHLSGGMRQRVMIAIAIACRPRVLIADEPTTALDVTIQAQVIDLLDRLRQDMRMALILITHDLGLVGQWADRVVVMYAGRKVEEAIPDALFVRPLHPYTRGLLGASPRLSDGLHYRRGLLPEIPGSLSSARDATGCPFLPRCDLGKAACAEAVPELIAIEAQRAVACPVVV